MTLLQTLGCIIAIFGAWLVSGPGRYRRHGFALFLLSNVVIGAWCVAEGNWPMLFLQLYFSVTNLRGMRIV